MAWKAAGGAGGEGGHVTKASVKNKIKFSRDKKLQKFKKTLKGIQITNTKEYCIA